MQTTRSATIARRRPWYAGLTRAHRAVMLAGLALLATATVALAYSLFQDWPFAGSIFDTGSVTAQSVITNDDSVESEPAGFDQGDGGSDPIGPADLTDPYAPVVRSGGNIQSCVGTIAGGDIHLALTNAFDGTRCAVKARIRNESARPMVYDGAEILGTAPVDVVQDPQVGQCIAPGATPFLHLEIAPQVGAAPGTVWAEADNDIRLTFHDVQTCG